MLLEFAKVANENNIKLITSHRSGESSRLSHISHIGIGTKFKTTQSWNCWRRES